jgi:hypothetical protein
MHIKGRIEAVYLHLLIGGYLDAIVWLHGVYPIPKDMINRLINGAIIYTQLHIIKWIYDTFSIDVGAHVFRSAAEYANLEIIKWMVDIGCPYDGHATKAALMNKTHGMEILDFLLSKGCPFDKNDANGLYWESLDMIKYLVKIGIVNFVYTIRVAIKNDAIDILEWYKNIEGRFIPKFYKYIGDDNVPILRDWCKTRDYLRESGNRGIKSAIRCENVELLWEYIDYNGANMCASDFNIFMNKVFEYVCEYESHKIMRNLISRDVYDKKDNLIMDYGIFNNNLDIIKYGYENGYELSISYRFEGEIGSHIKNWIESIGATGKRVIKK